MEINGTVICNATNDQREPQIAQIVKEGQLLLGKHIKVQQITISMLNMLIIQVQYNG